MLAGEKSCRLSGPIRGRPIGLPLRVPLAAALDMPARTRSRIIERSNSAKTPIIWNMALPDVGRVETLLMQVEINVLGMEHGQPSAQDRGDDRLRLYSGSSSRRYSIPSGVKAMVCWSSVS
jgi:hypothetical protein